MSKRKVPLLRSIDLCCVFDSMLTCVCPFVPPLAARLAMSPQGIARLSRAATSFLRWPLLEPHPSSLTTHPIGAGSRPTPDPCSLYPCSSPDLHVPRPFFGAHWFSIQVFSQRACFSFCSFFFWSRPFQLKYAAWQKMGHQSTSPRSIPGAAPSRSDSHAFATCSEGNFLYDPVLRFFCDFLPSCRPVTESRQ